MTTPMLRTHPRLGDEGSISVIAAVLVPALVLILALVVDGSGKMRAMSRADALAAEAARAAETAVDTRGTTVGIDVNTAVATARSYLQSAGFPGEVTVANARTVNVTVTVDEPAVIGLLGSHYHATGTATAELGVGTRAAGATL
jgi:hypothetical protein